MSFKTRIILYALFPLLLGSLAIALLTYQADILSEQELTTFENGLLNAKKASAKNYTRLAIAAIQPILDDLTLDEAKVKKAIKQILDTLEYDNGNGYFFVYDQQGINIVHPIRPEFVGKNLYNLKDSQGNLVVQSLLAIANNKHGGGFHRYWWDKPSANDTTHSREKISYVVKLTRWNWFLGTGFYVDDLMHEVTLLEHQIKSHILQTVYIVLAATLLLTIVLGYLINWRATNLANKHLRESAHRFVTLQVNERRCFARELHDGINQLLVATKHRIALCQRKTNQATTANPDIIVHLIAAEETLSTAIHEVRHLSHNLRPRLLDDMGLKTALNSMLNQYQERTGIRYQLTYQLVDEELPDDLEITLYRVIQEALTNTEKHADAQKITLHLKSVSNDILLNINDDGHGFCPQQIRKKTGIGLQNMRERIELLAGTFHLETSQKIGTHIKIILPQEKH